MTTTATAAPGALSSLGAATALTRFVPAIGRLLMGTIFLASGLSKLTAPAATLGYIQSAGIPLPQVALAAAVLVEIGGSLVLIAGYRARLVALALALFSVATALAFHTAFADQNQLIHFLKNLAMAGGLLQVVAFGAGGLSLDARAGRA
ncbi:DoxX family protein [Methylorubrum sp. DB1722]|uniref:DoxX family protein n=1 Tax=Methylorubrum sp. DB1722 TaxID=2478916 RepID=UPI0018E3140E|nr:DoxX family protein [Methylorubrum sp. DB1722]MBI1692187.1 DoxX family protein [Methylorubrum sp. DB1722]